MDALLDDVLEQPPTPLQNGFWPEQIGSTVTTKLQELIILPTEQCNLRCTYCYEDFEIGKMSEATQRGLEHFIDRRIAGLSQLRLSWFGGEPLAARDVILRIARHAKARCDEVGVRLVGGLTTNAYLMTRQLLEDLLDCNQDFFQITLDGWKETHDAVRRFADGRGSFDRIWANLLDMKTCERPFEVLLRIHVRRDNIDRLPELMKNLGAAFGGDDRFRLDFEHLRNLGGAGGASIQDPVKLSEIPRIDAEMRAIYRANSPRNPDRALEPEPSPDAVNIDDVLRAAKAMGESAGGQRLEEISKGGNYICYAAKANSLLIRANGRIGKCTVALNDDRNDIGVLNEDGTVTIDNDKLRPWLRGLSDLDTAALACPLTTLPRTLAPAPLEPARHPVRLISRSSNSQR